MRTSSRFRVSLLAAVAAVVALLGGCARDRSGEAEATGAERPRMTPQEADRGRAACEAYVDQICDCALAQAELTEDCELARSLPQALDMNLRAAVAEGNATERDRAAILVNARKIAQSCIEDSAALVKRGCQDRPDPDPQGSARRERSAPPKVSPPAARPEPGPQERRPVPAPPPEPEPLLDPTR
jgi:hypothetical protein